LKNPSEFWKDEIGNSAVNDFTPREPYIRIELEDDGVNIFNQIANYICSITSKKFFSQGYIDLDEEWVNNTDPQIVEWRENEALSKYLTPYSGRKAYQFKIPCQKMKDKDGKRTGKLSFGDIKPTNSGNWYMYGLVCLFHNEELGWTTEYLKPKTKKQMIDGVLTDVKVEGKEAFAYQNTSCFIEDLCARRLVKRISPELDTDPEMSQFYIYLMGIQVEAGEYNSKPSHSFNVDDYIIME